MNACFIGHRKITNTEQLISRLTEAVLKLIESGVDTFLFGSRSDFNSLCWEVVTDIQKQFPTIRRINYNAPHEVAITSREEREEYEQFYTKMLKHDIHFADYEEAVSSQKSIKANKNAYIMRNQDMIDNSDICVFYYNKDYMPPKRKSPNKFLPDYQPKSGTAIAYQYAISKKKPIINLMEFTS